MGYVSLPEGNHPFLLLHHFGQMIQLSLRKFGTHSETAICGRETPGVFGGSGKGILPTFRQTTKLVLQTVLHFFLDVFIYLHSGKLT